MVKDVAEIKCTFPYTNFVDVSARVRENIDSVSKLFVSANDEQSVKKLGQSLAPVIGHVLSKTIH